MYARKRSQNEIVRNILLTRSNRQKLIENAQYKDISLHQASSQNIVHLFSDLKILHPIIGKVCQKFKHQTKNNEHSVLILTRNQSRKGMNMPSAYLSSKESLFYAINSYLHFQDEFSFAKEKISRLYGSAMKERSYVEMGMFSLGVFALNNALRRNFDTELLILAGDLFGRIKDSKLLSEIAGVFQVLISILQFDFIQADKILAKSEFKNSYELKLSMEAMVKKYLALEVKVKVDNVIPLKLVA